MATGRPIHKSKLVRKCSECGEKHSRKNQRYCAPCHAAYMREWRKTHPMTAEQKKKDNARSYANTYYQRGHLHKVPCETCGSPKSEKHHEDYDLPLAVIWLCRPCHLALHRKKKHAAHHQTTSATKKAA